ncbi:MAG: outer membrane protein assembly factor BamD [Flavobacterium sp.]|uniref:outer membrane protein assembly factor BamD n=1 Tax=Flavobacterium sp. TaxID=239 RepID=UPI00121A27C9|nr:outer membrane protein assembly factor BamD [Flavobacterium sp.]RZJ65506.1 MAG: outer membrane protein assembly factor BamD [Flavobacterium sp.]
MKNFLFLMLTAALLASCSEYQKALKSEDVAVKYAAAEKKYEQGKYNKAIRLFEQMAPNYKGKPQAEKMFYMYAQSYYKTEQYYLAGYQFETFAAGYPKSEKAEEAAYLSAKSYANLSPVYSIDQVDTNKAIDKLQLFLDKYPDSEYLKEANETVKNLREKLEKKAYEIAYNYNKISDHKSAIVALDNFIADYPGTPYKEKALFYKLDSSYKLAVNSVPSKMQERLNGAKTAYANLLKFKADTEYKKDADDMLVRIENDLKQFAK